MSQRKTILTTLCLLLAVAISGCTAIVAAPGDPQAKVLPIQQGVDPASPLAQAVLLEFCDSSCELRPVDPATGATIEGFTPLGLGRYASLGLSTDHTQLAAIIYANNDRLSNGVLKFVDLATWETVTTPLTFDEAFLGPSFSPDNELLAVVAYESPWPAGKVVSVVDVASGELVAEQALDFHPSHLRFTPDGSGLMLFGADSGENMMMANATTQVALLDATTLATIWQEPVEELRNGNTMHVVSDDPHEGIWWQPAVVFAPDKAVLYVVHADQDQLTTIDFDTQQVSTSEITQPLSWIEGLLALTARTAYAKMLNGTIKEAALSPDGTLLYVVGFTYHFENEKFSEEMFGLQVINLTTGQEVEYIDTGARSISVEPNGARLFLHGWEETEDRLSMTEWTEVLDARSYQRLALLEDKSVIVGHRLNGQPILLSTGILDNGKTELSTMELESLAVINASAEWHSGYVGWITPH